METMQPDVELIPYGEMRRLTRREYERLRAEHFFGNERVELLFGTVVTMPPVDSRHTESTYRLHALLAKKLDARARVYCQSAFAAADDSEPQPDVYVTAPASHWDDNPSRAHLVVEIANSSLRRDRIVKARLYSRVDVEEYWIVDINAGTVEVYRDQDAGQWRTITTHRRGETISPLAFPDVVIAVSEIVPPID